MFQPAHADVQEETRHCGNVVGIEVRVKIRAGREEQQREKHPPVLKPADRDHERQHCEAKWWQEKEPVEAYTLEQTLQVTRNAVRIRSMHGGLDFVIQALFPGQSPMRDRIWLESKRRGH